MQLYKALHLVLLLFPLLSQGQTSYVLTQKLYGLESGLSSQNVLSLQTDGRGVLWVGTHNGLNRFDGHRFRNFSKYDGLVNNSVGCIFRLDDSYLLLGFGERDKYVRGSSHVQAFHSIACRPVPLNEALAAMPFEEAAIKKVRSISNGLHFALRNGQHYFRDSFGEFTCMPFLRREETLWAVQPSSHAWVSYVRHDSFFIKRYDLIKNTLCEVYLDGGDPVNTMLLREDSAGTVFFYSTKDSPRRKTTIFQIKADGLVSEVYLFADNQSRLFPWFTICHDPVRSGYWLSSKYDLIFFSEDWRPLFQIAEPGEGFDINYLENHFEAESIWHTNGQGLVRIGIKPKRFEVLFRGEDGNLPFRGITRVGDQLLFNGHDNHIYKKTADSVGLFSATYGLASALSSDGSFWTGNFSKLHRFEPGSQLPQTYRIAEGDLWALWPSPDSIIWYSTTGLKYLDPSTGQDSLLLSEDFEELAKATVYHFHPHAGDTVWLCTTEGLYVLDTHQRKVLARYWPGGQGAYYLPSGDLRHLYWDDATGEAWIATGQEGLLHWRPRTGEARLYPFHNLSMNIVHAVYPDDYGFLWLPTDDGLVQFERSNGSFQVYTVLDGLPTNEFNRCSHFRDVDGQLYFGGINGVVAFHPSNFRQARSQLVTESRLIVLEAHRRSNKSGQSQDLTTYLTEGNKLQMRPSDRTLWFSFTLSKPESAEGAAYFYQIDGYTDWQAMNGNQLSLWHLPYGKQTLLVKARLKNGTFTQLLEIPLQVVRPFYLTGWFITTIAWMLISLVYGRIRSLRRRTILLEAQVAQRTERIHQELANIQTINSKLQYFNAVVSHDILSNLDLILSTGNVLVGNKPNQEGLRRYYQMTQQTSQQLKAYCINLLKEIHHKKAAAQTELSDPMPSVRSVLERLDEPLRHANFRVLLQDLSPSLLPPVIVEQLFQNLLSNAIRYAADSPEPELHITEVKPSQGRTQWIIADNGSGIPAERRYAIFSPQSHSRGEQKGQGIGLSLLKSNLQALGASIKVEEAQGRGARFVVILPDSPMP